MITNYFAYGSNLLVEQVIQRTGALLEPAPRRVRLEGYRLAFNVGGKGTQRFANIVASPNDEVLGVIYSFDASRLEAMNRFETGYDQIKVSVIDEAGSNIQAVAYLGSATAIVPEGTPEAIYLDRIVRGAQQYQLPEAYIRNVERLAKG
jgi:gamma-glutamylcyclotransferase (GGCT)/AIG2-like uncharacterized protein YtfP